MTDQYTGHVNKFIAQTNAGVLKIMEYLETNKDPETRESLSSMLVYAKLKLTIAEYTISNKKAAILTKLMTTIEEFQTYFKWLGFERGYGQYDQMLWMVSLSILCDVSEDDFKAVTDVLKRDGANDRLLSFLIKSKRTDWEDSGAAVIQQSPYAIAGQIAGETDEAKGIDAIKNYLQNDWYKGNDDAPWHDSHNNKRVDSYFGYWAWETAAIVKIKGWNDEKLKDVNYYPYDAVHW